MKNLKSLIMSAILLIIIGLNVNAQNEIQEIKTRPFQLSFVTPLGTNGLESMNITNNFSFNIFAGFNGGLNGIEFSGFAGILKNNMNGAQFAGFSNIVLGKSRGVQFSGFSNINTGSFYGLQAAGFANIITNDAIGGQLAGFANVTTKMIDGIQIAGFANYSQGNKKGQISGFANTNIGDLNGVQIAGFGNVNTTKVDGIQIAGFANISERVNGAQIAGFANVTKKLNGVQIGVFNFVDSLESGIPIGVFSFVKNGYRTFEISCSETLYGIASFKTGTKQFYNIISVGVGYKKDKLHWGWGYGIGTLRTLKNNWDLAFELISFHINEDEWFTDEINLNNKFQITTSKEIAENLNVFAGLSWNVNVSKIEDHHGNEFESSLAPWTVFDKNYDNDVNIKMYPGFTAGIRF